jgi:hypothetical protein
VVKTPTMHLIRHPQMRGFDCQICAAFPFGDVAGAQRRGEHLFDIRLETFAVDWTVKDAGRIDAFAAQRRHEGHGDCDHTKLFPRMAAVVHHGGAGTIATASRAGVPQVVVSHLNEQYGWGWQTHRRGVGVRPIPRSKLTAARTFPYR